MTTNGSGSDSQFERLTLPPGAVVFYQFEPSDSLYILREGRLEALVAETTVAVPPREALLAVSRRVAVIEPPGLIGELGFILDQPRSATVRSLTAAQLTRVAAGENALATILGHDPRIALQLGRTLLRRYQQTLYQFRETDGILAAIRRLYDNGSLLYRQAAGFPETSTDPFLAHATDLETRAAMRYFRIPRDGKLHWLAQDLSDVFGNEYGLSATGIALEPDLVAMFEALLYAGGEQFLPLITETPEVMRRFCRHLGSVLPPLNACVVHGRRAVETEMALLAGSSGSLLAGVAALARRDPGGFAGTLFTALWRELDPLAARYLELWAEPLRGLLDGERVLGDLAAGAATAAGAAESAVGPADAGPFPAGTAAPEAPDAAGLAHEYLALAGLAAGEARARRPPLITRYWDHYRRVFIETEGRTPAARRLLRYGLLDPRLAGAERVAELAALPAEPAAGWPVWFADEWLERVYNGIETPGVTENGSPWQEVMKGAAVAGAETDQALLAYELDRVFRPAARMAAGGETALPFLTPETAGGATRRLTRAQVTAALEQVRALDYSLFYREVRLVNGEQVLFARKEVLPSVILIPIAGERVFAWQVLEGTNKHSRGRLVIPVFFRGDLTRALVTALGKFRWELAYTCAGYRWADPQEGELTGKYYDYLCNYARNPELTAAERDGLRALFRTLPSTTDKFAHDYELWLRAESQGSLKLNKVSRAIFFTSVPFPAPLREKLGKTTPFADLHRMDTILRQRHLARINAQLRKLAKLGIPIPPLLSHQLEFHQR